MTINIITPNGSGDSLVYTCPRTAIAAEVTGSEVSSGEGKLELKTTTGGTSATKVTVLADGKVGIGIAAPAYPLDVYGVAAIKSGESLSWKGDAQLSAAITGEGASPVLKFWTSQNERMRIDADGNLYFNSGYNSAAKAYGCRAWVNFNGTGTVAIREDGNVSSITDNGTGDYTVNFAVNMPDVNYAVTGFGARAASDSYTRAPTFTDGDTKSTSAFKFYMVQSGSASGSDIAECYIAIFR